MLKKILRQAIALSVLSFGLNANAQLFDFGSDLQGWAEDFQSGGMPNGTVSHSPTGGASGDGALMLVRATNNANFGFRNVATGTGIDATTNKFIRIVYRNNTTATEIRVDGLNGNGDAILGNSGAADDFINFPIVANSTEFVTTFLDMSAFTSWEGNLQNFLMLVRRNFPDAAGQSFLLDEIEFIDSIPTGEFSEFIKNPNFEDGSTIADMYTNFFPNGERSITNADAQDGNQSLRLFFPTAPVAAAWNFTSPMNTNKTAYSPTFASGTNLQVRMWVRTNRTSPVVINGRIELSLGGSTATTPIVAITTTRTDQDWEELTFDFVSTIEFDQARFWFGTAHPGNATLQLQAGDEVFFDNLNAFVDDDVVLSIASISNTKLEGASVNASNGTITVSGANLDAVYTITGQEVEATGLSSGLYIVKISQGDKEEVVKVAM